MALTRTQIRTLARKFASDTDTTNPFWSDTDVNVLIENWQSDMASYLRYPRATGTAVALVEGQDDYDLPTDWLSTIRVVIYDSAGYEAKLKYRSEDEISEMDPNWRNAGASEYGTPRYYFLANDITPGTSLARKLFVYPPPAAADTTKSILHIYVKAPTAISADANIPIFPGPMHMLAVYYVAWQMLMALDQVKAEVYRRLYESERRRMCGEGRKESEAANIILFK